MTSSSTTSTATDDGTATHYDDKTNNYSSSFSYSSYSSYNYYYDRLFVLNMMANMMCLVFYVWGRNRPTCVTYYRYVRYAWVLQYWIIFDRTEDAVAVETGGRTLSSDGTWRVGETSPSSLLQESISIGMMVLLRTLLSPSWTKPTLQIMIMYGFLTDYFILDTFSTTSKRSRKEKDADGNDGENNSEKKSIKKKNDDEVDVGRILLRVATNFCHHLYPLTASSCKSWVQTALCAVTFTTHLHPWFDVLGRRSWMGPCFMVGNWMPLLALVDWYFGHDGGSTYYVSKAGAYPAHVVVLTQMVLYRTLFANSMFKVFSTRLKLMTVEQETRLSDILGKGLLVYSIACAVYISPRWW